MTGNTDSKGLPMSDQKTSPRALALATLSAVERGQYGNIAVDTALSRHALSDADRHLYTALVYGVMERKTTLEYLLSLHSSRPIETLDNTVRLALSMGLYQLIYLDRVPDHAALDETVSLVPRRVSGYVNAVLRAYLRFEASLPPLPDGTRAPREGALREPAAWIARYPALAADPLMAMAVAYGVPVSLCKSFVEALGESRAASTLAAFGVRPDTTLRVNPLKTTSDALTATLTAEGFTLTPALYAPYALRVRDGALTSTKAFADGQFFIQDEASQLCVATLDAQPGEVVVDTCACPGSKSFGIALSMQNTGEIHAFDLHKSKLSLIETGAARLGISTVTADRRDARDPDPALIGRCDRVLCDVPCSGLGVIAKKPEIRHKDMTESARLPAIQAAILEASSRYLRVGGTLVYSTCTVLPAENEAVVSAFLAAHPTFEPVEFAFPAKDASVSDIRSTAGMVTLLPDANRTDGFFIAKMRRRA